MVNFTHSLGLQVDSDLRSYVGKLVEAAANKGYDGEKDDDKSWIMRKLRMTIDDDRMI